MGRRFGFITFNTLHQHYGFQVSKFRGPHPLIHFTPLCCIWVSVSPHTPHPIQHPAHGHPKPRHHRLIKIAIKYRLRFPAWAISTERNGTGYIPVNHQLVASPPLFNSPPHLTTPPHLPTSTMAGSSKKKEDPSSKGKGKGKGAADDSKTKSKGGDKSSDKDKDRAGKGKGAQSINVRHILVGFFFLLSHISSLIGLFIHFPFQTFNPIKKKGKEKGGTSSSSKRGRYPQPFFIPPGPPLFRLFCFVRSCLSCSSEGSSLFHPSFLFLFPFSFMSHQSL